MSYYHQGTNVTFLIFLKHFPANARLLGLSCHPDRGQLREVTRGRNQPKGQAHLQLGAIPRHLFPRLVRLPGECVHWRFLQTHQIGVCSPGAWETDS